MSTPGRLLIVDDELSVRDSLGKWFHEEGYEVETAEDASHALTLLATHPLDAALLDIKMHGTDGIELQSRMHEVEPDLIVIMMTGYASVETAVAALKNGAYDYVTKPLDPDEIAHLVKKALAHKQTEQENVRLRETVAEVARPEDIIGPKRGHEQSVRRHRNCRSDGCYGADHGGKRHWQGTGGAGDPSCEPAESSIRWW